jgi:hypothetical protein
MGVLLGLGSSYVIRLMSKLVRYLSVLRVLLEERLVVIVLVVILGAVLVAVDLMLVLLEP